MTTRSLRRRERDDARDSRATCLATSLVMLGSIGAGWGVGALGVVFQLVYHWPGLPVK